MAPEVERWFTPRVILLSYIYKSKYIYTHIHKSEYIYTYICIYTHIYSLTESTCHLRPSLWSSIQEKDMGQVNLFPSLFSQFSPPTSHLRPMIWVQQQNVFWKISLANNLPRGLFSSWPTPSPIYTLTPNTLLPCPTSWQITPHTTRVVYLLP